MLGIHKHLSQRLLLPHQAKPLQPTHTLPMLASLHLHVCFFLKGKRLLDLFWMCCGSRGIAPKGESHPLSSLFSLPGSVPAHPPTYSFLVSQLAAPFGLGFMGQSVRKPPLLRLLLPCLDWAPGARGILAEPSFPIDMVSAICYKIIPTKLWTSLNT